MVKDTMENNGNAIEIESPELLLFKKVKESVGDEFESKLSACEDDISRVELLKQSFQWVPKVYKNLGDFSKNADYSTKLRETGNQYYRNKNLEQGLRGYNLAIVYAPYPSTPSTDQTATLCSTENSKESTLALAFGNRSAVWTALEKYEEAIFDINFAIQHGYPEHLMQKLKERQNKCKNILKEQKNKIFKLISTDELEKRRKFKNEVLFKINDPNPLMPVAKNIVDIRVDPLRGRQLIVTVDVTAGTVLVVEEPFVKILQKGLKWDLSHCHFCFKKISAGIPCSGCVFAMYCNQTCADSAMKQYHSYECPCMPYLHISKASAYTRLTLRIIFTVGPEELYRIFKIKDDHSSSSSNIPSKCLGCDPITDVYDSSSYFPIYHLISHINDLKIPEKFTNTLQGIIFSNVLEEFTKFYSKIKYEHEEEKFKFKDFIAATILHQSERVQFNGISLSEMEPLTDMVKIRGSEKPQEIGGGIYPVCSLMNHSCTPNVTRVLDMSTGKMAIIATANLKTGDELLTTYTKIFFEHERDDRQKYLKDNFNFICDCVACSENWPKLDELSKIEPKFCCTLETCAKVPLDGDAVCKKCGKSYDLLKLVEEFNEQIKHFHEGDELILRNSPLEAIQLLITCMMFFQSHLCPPFSKFIMAQDLLKQALDLIVKTSE